MAARRSPLHAAIVKPEHALPIKPFGLDMKVLLTTEATGGAISVIMERRDGALLQGPSTAADFIERVRSNQQRLAAELKPHYDFIVW
jgi:hypothetical protein